VTREIVESGARIVFVGMGCPKQERWMAAHKGRIPAVMLGVGAAFDFHGAGASGPTLDASVGSGVGLQAADGSAAVVEALREAQPKVRGAVLATAGKNEGTRRKGASCLRAP